MKVKFIKDYLIGTVLFKAGEEEEFNDALADKLIRDRFAESTIKPVKKPVKKEAKKTVNKPEIKKGDKHA